MKVYLDRVDNLWRIRGHEEHKFTTESDAQTAIDFAIDFAVYEVNRESRHRRAAAEGQETVGEYTKRRLAELPTGDAKEQV